VAEGQAAASEVERCLVRWFVEQHGRRARDLQLNAPAAAPILNPALECRALGDEICDGLSM
jgi:hypothetical protein